MKVRYDFVTNSSSTSFIIINDGEFNFKTFTERLGLKNNSEFLPLFRGLFNSFRDSMKPVRDHYTEYRKDASVTFEDFITKSYAPGTYQRIIDAESEGKTVYAGRVNSDRTEVESFFCTDSYIIESEKMYIDGTIDGW